MAVGDFANANPAPLQKYIGKSGSVPEGPM